MEVRPVEFISMISDLNPEVGAHRGIVTLGFKPHTGWAIIVALTGAPGKLTVLLRARIDLYPPGNSTSRFAYHRASELPTTRKAADCISQAKAASRKASHIAVKDVLDSLEALGFQARVAALPSTSRRLPEDLAVLLRSHPMLHTAEGILYQQAIASACESEGLEVIAVPEREVWPTAATRWGAKEAALRKEVEGLRKSVGTPWAADHRTAAGFALVAMKPVR